MYTCKTMRVLLYVHTSTFMNYNQSFKRILFGHLNFVNCVVCLYARLIICVNDYGSTKAPDRLLGYILTRKIKKSMVIGKQG